MLLRPDPLIGEYYMRGELVLTEGSFEDFITFLFQNTQSWRNSLIEAIYSQFWEIFGWFAFVNPVGRSRSNVAHHDDEAFIRMWQFYLICSENYFRYAHGMVFQI